MYKEVLLQLVNAARNRGAISLGMPSQDGLSRTRALLQAMTTKSFSRPLLLHVVGTNGKGSVCWKTCDALLRNNIASRVGMYTSPHLFSVRERIRVNKEMIPKKEFTELGQRALQASQALGGSASYFELVTCMALEHFSNVGCDAIVLEAGMGGLGDATNVVPHADVVCLTHVGLEHCGVLGNTLEQICKEKLGVCKPGSRVVIGPSVPRELDALIMQQCAALGAIAVKRLLLSNLVVEEENAMIASACVEELFASRKVWDMENGVRPRCRMETVYDYQTNKPVVLDVGHNASALQRVFNELKPGKRVALVFGIAQDKDLIACLRAITTVPDWARIDFVKPALKERKFAEPAELHRLFLLECSGKPPSITTTQSVQHALRNALNDHSIDTVVCCGSHALMREAFEEIMAPSNNNSDESDLDPFDTNERGGGS